MDVNHDVDLSRSAFRLTNAVEPNEGYELGRAIVLEVTAKICFKRVNGRPVLHLQVTDPGLPFQPISVGGANLPGNHLICQTPELSAQATQQAMASLADLAAGHRMSEEVTDIMLGGTIKDDGDFWDLMKPVLKGYFHDYPHKFRTAREIYVVRFVVPGGYALSLFVRRIVEERYLSYVLNPPIMYMPTA